MKRIALTVLFALTSTLFFGQFVLDQTLTIEEYVNDILLGSGIQATNVSFTGDMAQIGYLTNDDTPEVYPMDGGLVLACDHAENFILDGAGGFITGVSGEPDLLDIANDVPGLIGQSFNVSSVNDVAILEFDFVATGDSISFNYSFGSDEWTTWINSSFNDIFAFFLSGPGIAGPYDSPGGFPDGAINIAGVPNTDPNLPVTISSVHNGNPDGSDCLNCEYYVYNVPQQDVQINAFTTLFTAEAEVVCGETYHIKLAIADGTDTALKSVVVLEEGSFSSNSVVQVDLTIDVGGPEANTIYEDCGAATLSFTRPIETILEIEEMVIIEYGGDAQELLDYNDLPDTVFFAPFVETVSFEVTAFDDGIDEPTELVILEILNLAACSGEGLTSYFEFYIADTADPLVVEGFDITICGGDTIELEPDITGGYGNYIFNWDSGETTETIFASPEFDTNYNLIVSDTCGMPDDDADFLVSILVVPPLEVEIDQGDFEISCGGSLNLTATATGGDGNYTDWYWYDEDDLNLWGWENTLWYNAFNGATEINVDVTDGCGFTSTGTVEVTMDIPELIVDLEDMTVLCNEVFTIDPGVSGGESPYYYQWQENGTILWDEWQSTYTTSTDVEIDVTFMVSDNCGQNETVDIVVEVESPEIIITMPEDPTGTCIDEFSIVPDIEGGSGGFSYIWNEDGVDISANPTITITPGTATTLNFSVDDQCGQFAEASIDINIENPPLEVTLGEDVDASCIDSNPFIAEVTGGSGNFAYQWTVNDEIVGDDPTLSWQSFETVDIQVYVVDACEQDGDDEVTLNIPNIPLEMVVSEDSDVCQFEEVELMAIASGGEGGFTYNWEILPGNDTLQYVQPGESTNYLVTATDICGKIVEGNILVTVHPIDVGYGLTYETASTVQFTSVVMPNCEDCTFDYLWDFGDGEFSSEIDPLHQYDGLSSYNGSIVVVNEIGCRDSASFTYLPPVSIYVPNSFSPNNDGINDYFSVFVDGVEKYKLTIFNRWGEVVYQTTDTEDKWLGEVQDGQYYYSINNTYSYIIELKGYNTDAFTKTGSITVLR